MIVVARLHPPESSDEPEFVREVAAAVTALGSRPGHLSSRLCRALDDPSRWLLVSEWADVGSYRRALSSYDVKMASGVLMGAVADEPSAYEPVELDVPH